MVSCCWLVVVNDDDDDVPYMVNRLMQRQRQRPLMLRKIPWLDRRSRPLSDHSDDAHQQNGMLDNHDAQLDHVDENDDHANSIRVY